MNKHQRRWKKGADQARSPADFADERDRVALEIAARLAGWCAADEVRFGGLQDRVVGLVEDSWVRASLAAKYLDRLQDNLRIADYEDVQSLREELSWTRAYLSSMPASAPSLEVEDLLGRHLDDHRPAAHVDRLFGDLAAQLAPRLEIAPAA